MSSGAPTIGGLKRLSQFMAGQLKSAVSITGGTITGVTLGLASGQAGTFTANGTSTVTVASTVITANSQVLITLKTVSGTVGAIPSIKTITPSTGFTVSGTALDTSVYNFLVIG